MTSKLTREWLQHQISAIEAVGITDSNTLAAFKLALAAMESEPVAWMHSNNDIGIPAITVSQKIGHYWMAEFENVQPLYRHAQPAPETEREPIAWLNDAYLARGVVDGEAGSEDAGPGYIPVYREASPAQPAPVVLVIPDEMTSGQAYEIGYYYGDPVDVFARGANWMRQHIIDSTLAASQQSPGSEPATVPGKWIPVSERMPEMGEHQCYVLAADFKNHYWPNIPNTQVGVYGDWFDDGNPTWDDGDGEDLHLKEVTHWMPLPAAPQEVKGE
ncbi:DUF551 domain-containing protein [Klebsiella pneumoniae]|nr:DUF551 domain-containing protein [Klebsiella pneumoniae]WQD08207.1 DUF551 domain-containing protein [Klebsiella pneumoniae]